jgi:ABC-type glycerol-3-phosphate transport system substrate-binding protein
MTIESSRIFYNKDLFRRVTGSDRPPETFGEWMEICAAIRSYGEGRDEKLFPIAATREYALLSGFNSFYLTAFTGGMAIPYDVNAGGGPTTQGTLWGFQTGTLDFNQERVRAVYDIQLELAENFQPGFISDTEDQARFLFIQGRAGMVLGNTYDLILFRDAARFEVGVFKVPLPDPGDPKYGRYVTGRIWEEPVTKFLFGLSKESRNKEIALDFMKFATSVRNNEWFCRQLDWFPAIKGAGTSDELQVFAPSAEGVSASLELVTGPDIGLYFDQNFLLFLGGHLSFDDFMDGLEDMWRTKGEEWLMVKRFAITKQEDISRERNLSRSRVKVLFEEAGEMAPGQTMGSGTAYQLGVQIVQAFFAHSFTYRQFIHPHIKDGTYQFPPYSLMPKALYPIPPPDDVLEGMLHRRDGK